MDLQLNGKRALVTGSNSGIGAGIARTLAAEGATVVIHGRHAGRAEEVVAQIKKQGGQVLVALGDLATEAGCIAVGDSIIQALSGIDILVNNAGGRASMHRHDGRAGPMNAGWLDIPWSDWQWTFEQNVGAAVRLIQRFVPGMIQRNWGRVINIGSASATQTEPNLAEYQAIKAAMANMTTSLAKTLAHTGITVNTVTPGTIVTPAVVAAFTHWAQQLGWKPKEWSEIERRFTTEVIPQPVNHFGQPEDIGRMVTLLASPLSSYMTGANYRVDGGQCRSVN
jgi:3-oxoacyl-[acyl-carrier protein] reductase